MTNDDARKTRWTEAAHQLAADPDARIACPTCERGRLRVEDTPPKPPSILISRTITCNACGAHIAMKIERRPVQ